MEPDQIIEFLEGLTNQARRGNLTAFAVAYRVNGQPPVAFKAEGTEGALVARAPRESAALPFDLDDFLRD